MKVTIVEVAKKANVSVATVSRVMNGNYPVKNETKEAVLKAIKELKYIPNIQARELTQQRSSTIGVIGFDNIELCIFIEPNLTTIDQNMNFLGKNAVELLLEKINSNNEFSKNIVLNNKGTLFLI